MNECLQKYDALDCFELDQLDEPKRKAVISDIIDEIEKGFLYSPDETKGRNKFALEGSKPQSLSSEKANVEKSQKKNVRALRVRFHDENEENEEEADNEDEESEEYRGKGKV